MMQVEEKPDVTYSDVGGCKEQIEKLREVVELPLLEVRLSPPSFGRPPPPPCGRVADPSARRAL